MRELGLLARCLMTMTLFAGGCTTTSDGGDDDGDDGTSFGVDGGPDDDDDDSGDGGDDDDPGAGECEPELIEMPTEPACSGATKACFDGCEDVEDDTCADDCLAADPDEEGCSNCLDDGFLSCANALGCQPEWDALLCCFDACADPDSPACESSCAGPSEDYELCLAPHDEECTQAVDSVCFDG